jgi:hypothetical protein
VLIGDVRVLARELDAVASPLRGLILGHRLVREAAKGLLPRPKLKNLVAQIYYRIRYAADQRLLLATKIPEQDKEMAEAKKLCLQMSFGDLNQHQLLLKACRALSMDIKALSEGALMLNETERELAWEHWLLTHASPSEACIVVLYVPLTLQVRLYPRLLEALTTYYGLSASDAEYFHMNGPLGVPREEAGKKVAALLIRDERDKERALLRARQAFEGTFCWLTSIYRAPGI